MVLDELRDFAGGYWVNSGAVDKDTRLLGRWWLEVRGENGLEYLTNMLRFGKGTDDVVLWSEISRCSATDLEG